jgi:hypothetical protein
VQRAAPWTAVERTRLFECGFRIEIHEGLDGIVTRRNARNAIAHHRFAGRRARRDLCHDLGRGKLVERVLDLSIHGDADQFFPARPAEVPAILPNTVPDISPEPPG